jgi:thiol-disulfide isomerase/thioredoxin
MKNILTLVLLLTGFATFSQTAIKTDSVYISGAIGNYAKYKDSANSVQFIINDILSGTQVTYRAKIADNAAYKIAFLKTGPQDVYIEYNNDLETVIIAPGQHLQIDFDASKFETSLSFKGDGAKTNIDFKAWQTAFDAESTRLYGTQTVARYRAMATHIKDDDADAYAKHMAKRYTADSVFLANYLKQHKGIDPVFVKWVNTNLKYELYENLMRFVWMHPMYNGKKATDFTPPESYYGFVKTAAINDPSLSITSKYGGFLAEYGRYLIKDLPATRTSKDVTDKYAAQPASFAKDVIVCQRVFGLLRSKKTDIAKEALAAVNTSVTNADFKNKTTAAYATEVERQNNYQAAATAKVNNAPKTEADSLFSKLIGKYANKVVYIDFWGTWCGPCREEMPNAKLLREKFIGKDVVFLYLGVQSAEKAWKDMIAQLDIKGEHYLLNNNEYSALSEKFQISGIPRYILVDRNGRVFSDNAKRPGDDKLKPEIDALLDAK